MIVKNFIVLLAVGFILQSCNPPMAKTVVYDSPGDLSQVEGLSESPFFSATIDGKPAFVYYGKEDVNNRFYEGRGVSYLNFEMSAGPVNFEVLSSLPIDSFSILPFEGTVQRSGEKGLTISIDEPTKFLISTFSEKKERHDFIVSAETPDWKKPEKGDKGVLYLEAGIHHFGEAWNPFTNDIHTLYLEGGAVVEATLKIVDADKVSILGRGIFAQAFSKHGKRRIPAGEAWFADCMGIYINKVKKVKVEGIAVLNSPSYQLEVNNANEFYMNNVKLCGFGESNNDGLHVYSRNATVENSFICSNDDRICLNGLFDNEKVLVENEPIENRMSSCIVENVVLKDLVTWGCKNGADIMFTWNAAKDTRTVFVDNIMSLAPTNKAFISAMHGGSGLISDVVIANCHLYHGNLLDLRVNNASCWGKGGGNISSIVIDNVSMDADPQNVGKQMLGFSTQSTISNVILSNLSANGKPIESLDQTGIVLNEFVKGIGVK